MLLQNRAVLSDTVYGRDFLERFPRVICPSLMTTLAIAVLLMGAQVQSPPPRADTGNPRRQRQIAQDPEG